MSYREDITGLRAIAVLAVIAYHFEESLARSGFLGVDIFFVISGFVVTSSLAGRTNPSVSDYLVSFYARRVKRLLPALICNVALTAVVGFLFIPIGSHVFDVSWKTGLTSLVGMSNIYLQRAAFDYFAVASEFNLFSQTWSLGVEEQFYAVFPMLLSLCGFSRNSRASGARVLFRVTLGLCVASLAAFVWLVHTDPSVAFYLMPARFWELGLGCLTFIAVSDPRVRAGAARIAGVGAPLCIALLIPILVSERLEQAPATIAAVFVSAVLIGLSEHSRPVMRLLTSRPMVWIGLLSYSLYLWHWSVLTISRWTIGVTPWTLPFQALLIVGLSAASYYWIEQPLRFARWSPSKGRTIGYGLLGSAAAGVIVLVIAQPLRESVYVGATPSFDLQPLCSGNPARARALLAGDSHARSFRMVLDPVLDGDCARLSPQDGVGSGFLFSHALTEYSPIHGKSARTVRVLPPQALIERLGDSDARVLVASAYWQGFFSPPESSQRSADWVVTRHVGRDGRETTYRDALAQTIDSIAQVARSDAWRDKSIAIVLPPPDFNWLESGKPPAGLCEPEWFRSEAALRQNCHEYLVASTVERSVAEQRRAHIVAAFEKLAAAHPNVHLFDPLPVLCDDGRCSTHDAGGPIFEDDDHIHRRGAARLRAAFSGFLEERGLFETLAFNPRR